MIPYRPPELAERIKAELARRTTSPGLRSHPWLDPVVPELDGARYGLAPGRLYAGTFGTRWVQPPADESIIAIGRKGTGKTRRLVVPNCLLWPGSVLATSVKPDLIDLLAPFRTRRGGVWVWDPFEVAGQLPPWVRRLDHSLVAGCADMQIARRRARALMTRAGRGVSDGDLWQNAAIRVIALMLHAAALRRLPDARVRSWVARQSFDDVIDIIDADGSADARDELDGLRHSRADRTIDSQWWVVGTTFSAFDVPSIQRSWQRAAASTWDATAFLQHPGTLILVQPEDQVDDASPLAVSLIDDIHAAALTLADRSPSRALDVPLLLALDEMRHTAPSAALARLITTGRSRRIRAIAAFQHYGQVETVFGHEADGLVWSGCSTVVFPGAGEKAITSRLADLSGPVGFPRATTSRSAEGLFPGLRIFEAHHSVHRGYADRPRVSEAEVSDIPHDRAWVRMPGVPLGLVETWDVSQIDPFAAWSRMPAIVDVVSAPRLPQPEDEPPVPTLAPEPAWWDRLR
jgi:type IV secretory pathway TraG/TraD family ATPase VirD4